MQPTRITQRLRASTPPSAFRVPHSLVPTTTVGFALLALIVTAIGVALLSGPGCVSTPEGLAKADSFYQTATNDIAIARPIIQNTVPPPWNAVAEAVLGLVTAGLTTWNLQQHRRIAALEAATPTPNASAPTRGSP